MWWEVLWGAHRWACSGGRMLQQPCSTIAAVTLSFWALEVCHPCEVQFGKRPHVYDSGGGDLGELCISKCYCSSKNPEKIWQGAYNCQLVAWWCLIAYPFGQCRFFSELDNVQTEQVDVEEGQVSRKKADWGSYLLINLASCYLITGCLFQIGTTWILFHLCMIALYQWHVPWGFCDEELVIS